MQATRHASIIGPGPAPATIFARHIQAMLNRFAYLLKKLASVVLSINFAIVAGGLQPSLSAAGSCTETQNFAPDADFGSAGIMRILYDLRNGNAVLLIQIIASVVPKTLKHLFVIRKQQGFSVPVVVECRAAGLGGH